ncbi:MAG: hypothetical protein LBT84_03330 [Spirochaetia bacterium]|jgi:hypothetical protein|nr:hypothetical protein [Spirochaetia bacterium]
MIEQPLKLIFKSDIQGAEFYYGKNSQYLGVVDIPLMFYADEDSIRRDAVIEIKRQMERLLQDNRIIGSVVSIINAEKFKFVDDDEDISLMINSNGDILVL